MVVRRWLVFRQTLNFFATRFVDAESREAAEEPALREVRGEPRLAVAAIRAPTLAVEEIEAVDSELSRSPAPGIVFYPAGANRGANDRAT